VDALQDGDGRESGPFPDWLTSRVEARTRGNHSTGQTAASYRHHPAGPTIHLSEFFKIKVIQTWFNSESGMEAGVSQLGRDVCADQSQI
jgi:hypothetical protein